MSDIPTEILERAELLLATTRKDVQLVFEPLSLHTLAFLKDRDQPSYRELMSHFRDAKVCSMIDLRKAVEREYARSALREGRTLVDPGNPDDAAHQFRKLKAPHLVLYQGHWMDYDGTGYVVIENETVKQKIANFLRGTTTSKGPTKVTPTFVAGTKTMLKTLAYVEHDPRQRS